MQLIFSWYFPLFKKHGKLGLLILHHGGTMFNILILWSVALITMIAIDMIWIKTMVRRIYVANIGHLMAKKSNLYPAVAFFILYVTALVYFILCPAQTQDWSIIRVLISGAFFGIVSYGTFDLTNHAIMKNWSMAVTIIDMLWGGFLTAVTCVVSLTIASWLYTQIN